MVHGQASKSRRYKIRKGRAAGIESRLAESLDDYRAYFGAYQSSLRRWGTRITSTYPWTLFEAGCELARDHPDVIQLWVAQLRGRIISGAWVFCWNDHAVYWHGASSAEGLEVDASSVLFADIIDAMCQRGSRWFDFNPSGGHAGVAEFKRSFGAERWPVRRHSYTRPWLRVVRMIKPSSSRSATVLPSARMSVSNRNPKARD